MHFILRQILPDGATNPVEIHLTKDEYTVGRRSTAPLARFPQVSRDHATFFTTEDGHLFVKDLNSLNGIFVNDVRIGPSLKQLSIGDAIGFGVDSSVDGGFVCILCVNEPPDLVKNEVVIISSDEEDEPAHNSVQQAVSRPHVHNSVQQNVSKPHAHSSVQQGVSTLPVHISLIQNGATPHVRNSIQQKVSKPHHHNSTHQAVSTPHAHSSVQQDLSTPRAHNSIQQDVSAPPVHISSMQNGSPPNVRNSVQQNVSKLHRHNSVQKDVSTLRTHNSVQKDVSIPNVRNSVQQNVSKPYCHNSVQKDVSTPNVRNSVQQNVSKPHSHNSVQKDVSTPNVRISVQQNVSKPHNHNSVQKDVSTPNVRNSVQQNVSKPHSHNSVQKDVSTPNVHISVEQDVRTPYVPLIKCDSKYFQWPPDVKNPFLKKHKRSSIVHNGRSSEYSKHLDGSDVHENLTIDRQAEKPSTSYGLNKKSTHKETKRKSSRDEISNIVPSKKQCLANDKSVPKLRGNDEKEPKSRREVDSNDSDDGISYSQVKKEIYNERSSAYSRHLHGSNVHENLTLDRQAEKPSTSYGSIKKAAHKETKRKNSRDKTSNIVPKKTCFTSDKYISKPPKHIEKEPKTHREVESDDSDDGISYSQVEEVIYISDDDSYFDFKSVENYIKKEPEEMDESEELARLEEIFESDSESECSKTNNPQSIYQNDDESECIEDIRAFVCEAGDEKREDHSNVGNNSPANNEYFPVLSQDSDNEEDGLNASKPCDRNIPSGVDLNQNSTHKNKGNRKLHFMTTSAEKPKIKLIEPKPLPNLSRRGRREERQKDATSPVAKKESRSKLPPVKHPGNFGLKSNFKIPIKQKKNNIDHHSEHPRNELSSGSEFTSSDSAAKPKKRMASVKTRPEKFSSRMGFLVDPLASPPKVNNKHPTNVTAVQKVAVAPAQNTRSSEMQSKNGSRKESVPYPQATGSGLGVTSKLLVAPPVHKKWGEGSRTAENVPPAAPKSVVAPPVHKKCAESSHTAENVPPAAPKSVAMPREHNRDTVVYNHRDPRLKSSSSRQVGSSTTTASNMLPLKERHTMQNSAISNHRAAEAPVSSRQHNSISFELRMTLIKRLIKLNTKWLEEQARMKYPPPAVSEGAAALPLKFKSYESYVAAYMPMIMLEIWEQMFVESKEVFASRRQLKRFYFSVLEYSSKDDYIELKCESVVNEKLSFTPFDGNMAILNMKERSKNISPVFGYINNHTIKSLKLQELKCPYWKEKLPAEWFNHARHFIFHAYIKKKETAFELGTLMKGNGLCYIKNKIRWADALSYLKTSRLLPNILQPKWKSFLVNFDRSLATREYNSSQIEVITGITHEINQLQPKIVLLQGPPGTGKTHTIIGLIQNLLSSFKYDSQFKILVTTPSNAAVDEIGGRLISLNEKPGPRVKFVRIGSENQIHPKLKPYFLDKMVQDMHRLPGSSGHDTKEMELQNLYRQIDQLQREVPSKDRDERLHYLREKCRLYSGEQNSYRMSYQTEMECKTSVIKESHIILSTLSSCGLPWLVRMFHHNNGMHFLCCIVDEATQCTEVEILQPLMLRISRLVLVGDHKQLPATVIAKVAVEHRFDRSAFERFHLYFHEFCKKSPLYTLTEQYRMHSAICEFPSKYIYDRKVITNPNTDIKYNDFALHPYTFLDILVSQESDESSSKTNSTEALVIVNICSVLLDMLYSASSIGIITPYQAQRSLYIAALHKERASRYRDIEVNTIDGFQGREKDIIILSSVRANSDSGSIGFLSCKRRLNVAITRAKKCLIICAHADSLSSDPGWTELVKNAKERDRYVAVTSPKDIPMLFRLYLRKNNQN